MGELRPFATEGSTSMFIGPEPVFDIFFFYVYLRGLSPHFDQNTLKRCFSLGLCKPKPEITEKTCPRLIQSFIKVRE